VQVVDVVAAVETEYVPTPQLLQAAVPLASLYVPAEHGEHDPPSGPVYPALQVQSTTASLAPGELELPGQARQLVAAVEAEYFPAPHDVQVVDVVAAVETEYVPTPQLLQAALPLAIL
jgi:hypothetical protein